MTDPRRDNSRRIKSPTGTEISAKSWLTEAPLRMLMNNLDADVAERPEELVVYGGIGRAARNWEAFDRIVASLRSLEDDETLLVQSGKPGGMGGAQPLAATMAGASMIAIECQPSRIDFRLRTRYLDTKAATIDEALEIVDRSHRLGKPISVGLLGNAAELVPEFLKRGIR